MTIAPSVFAFFNPVLRFCTARKKLLRVLRQIGYAEAAMEEETPNINVIRSVWRRLKKDIKVRDLEPLKDIKGGARGGPGKSKPNTGGIGNRTGRGSQ